MNTTLLITYTPRTGSNTKKIADAFKAKVAGKTKIIEVDLASNPPDLLVSDNLNIFLKANYSEEHLTEHEEFLLNKNNTLATQLQNADIIVLAYPMYNFSLPAAVKAWLDAVILINKTFILTPKGFEGLCGNKKALILTTTGYDVGKADFATPLMQTALGFMGIESETVIVVGLNQFADKADLLLLNAEQEIEKICSSWYA